MFWLSGPSIRLFTPSGLGKNSPPRSACLFSLPVRIRARRRDLWSRRLYSNRQPSEAVDSSIMKPREQIYSGPCRTRSRGTSSNSRDLEPNKDDRGSRFGFAPNDTMVFCLPRDSTLCTFQLAPPQGHRRLTLWGKEGDSGELLA
jgi:hypothetical protein